MACHVGEPVKGSAGGWLRRRSKLWRLPFHMHPMAEVCTRPARFSFFLCLNKSSGIDKVVIGCRLTGLRSLTGRSEARISC